MREAFAALLFLIIVMGIILLSLFSFFRETNSQNYQALLRLKNNKFSVDRQLDTEKEVCIITGCSSQVCSDKEVITTCEIRPEYACYKNAICELQTDGKCGWTETPELKECLSNLSGKIHPIQY